MVDLRDLIVNLEKTKGAIDFYNELLTKPIEDKELKKQQLLLVKGEILKLTMKTDFLANKLENKLKK